MSYSRLDWVTEVEVEVEVEPADPIRRDATQCFDRGWRYVLRKLVRCDVDVDVDGRVHVDVIVDRP